MLSDEKSFALYGSEISASTRSYFRWCQAFLVTVCALGALCQIIQVAVPGAALELVCAGLYLVYNAAGMLIIRVANVGFKFEDAECLKIAVRIAAAMALYGIVIFVTVPTFGSNLALALMGIFGLVNVLIILPTNVYEDILMLRARSKGVGLETARPLTTCENAFVCAFLILANVFIGLVIATALAILATGGSPTAWHVLSGFYVAMNIVPIVLPKVEHLVSTETRTWPLKVLLVHFAFVFLSVLILGAVLSTQSPTRGVRVLFGTVGVLNGVLVAIALGVTALRAIYAPRTLSATADVKELELEGGAHPEAGTGDDAIKVQG